MSGSSATAHKGKLYLFGGLNLVKEITYNSLYTFSPGEEMLCGTLGAAVRSCGDVNAAQIPASGKR